MHKKLWLIYQSRSSRIVIVFRFATLSLLILEGMIQDITGRKNREDELRRQLEELKIEIDHKKREKEVAMLTASSYFQEVQQEVAEVNLDEFWS